IPRSTEVRIKYGGQYIAAGEVYEAPVRINEDGPMLHVRAEGFLNLFKSRFVEETIRYEGVNAPQLGANLINLTQAGGDDWDFGVTIGNVPTIGNHDITYRSGDNIK